MGLVNVQLRADKLAAVERDLAAIGRDLRSVLPSAVNDVTRWGVTRISQRIRERVNIKAGDISPHIRRTYARPADPTSKITIEESQRLSLKYFGAKQAKRLSSVAGKRGASRGKALAKRDARKGVFYQIMRRGGKKQVADAFGPNLDRLGKHVYKRVGKRRLPIVMLKGPSAWGVVVQARLDRALQVETTTQLEKRITSKVTYLTEKFVAKGSIAAAGGGGA